MRIEDLMLKKEELAILNECCLEIPIHPKLLSPDINIDPNLARQVFPRAVEEWYNDLRKYSESLDNEDTKEWIERVFLKKKPKIRIVSGEQGLDTLCWQDKFFTSKNGFAHDFMISRNAGGSLYFTRDDMNCEAFVLFDATAGYIQFSKAKALEFNIESGVRKIGDGQEGVKVHIYGSHNVDHYPGALFLKNWVILYLNEAMKQVLK